jgi:hypothetical protein
MSKKIVLLSLGGSVGKTMLTTQLLHPHMLDARILCVDQTNDTAEDFGIKNCEKHSGDDFNRTYRALMESPGDVIVDVGGTKECKEFMSGMLLIDGSDEVTTIIVPSRPDSKDQACALETIETLILDGVDKSKIRVVFTGTKKSVPAEFGQLISGMRDNGMNPDLDLNIGHSVLFNEMIREKKLILNIMADTTDYKAAEKAKKKGDSTDYIGKLMRQRMARSVWPNLQSVFSRLFADPAPAKILH